MVGYVILGWIRRAVGAIMASKLGHLLPDRPSVRSRVVRLCEAVSLNNRLEIRYIGELVGKYETKEVSIASGM